MKDGVGSAEKAGPFLFRMKNRRFYGNLYRNEGRIIMFDKIEAIFAGGILATAVLATGILKALDEVLKNHIICKAIIEYCGGLIYSAIILDQAVKFTARHEKRN